MITQLDFGSIFLKSRKIPQVSCGNVTRLKLYQRDSLPDSGRLCIVDCDGLVYNTQLPYQNACFANLLMLRELLVKVRVALVID